MALAGAGLLCPAALAQTAPGFQTPKTSWGAPDLTGFWTNTSLTSMQRPAGADRLVLNEKEAEQLTRRNVYSAAEREEAGASKLDEASSKELLSDGNASRAYNRYWMDPGTSYAQVKGQFRSSWITYPQDGRIPYTEAGIRANTRTNSFDDFEIRPLPERCIMSFGISSGPVMTDQLYNNTYQFVQTEDNVVILVEMVHDARIIPLNTKHRADGIKPWMGDSIGRWDGDTLVVETVGFHAGQNLRGGGANMKVTERFTRVAPDRLHYAFDVQDPDTWAEPWGGEYEFASVNGNVYEYACHEGNHALPGILGGARMDDREGRVTGIVGDSE